ncbi:MAG: hypothetical protein A3G32_09580 [Deltaproteobacteria bacterium RIFCSPLOWO2_12_FULL_40_28]|nr:MAG: hypothetical protein A3C45_07850 [Deltaproteobacteria bacterium RIFCSPHIGHO2_02_FULL_40_28]OGQ20531.1 MAG: hypothetical protein A3E27_02640 [Deltaproteobacteria bacterium RIFCSPHIGHO2_12_FULL_40_32]OGQ41182.1 MAG: hypothetical protein A3I69_07875 [Deltaproteobacteria bacterium RIFCSPLOWO2_02_FULL_40_36]OGQ55144.1 MAG: hypothetical protein A3G32_09580 [Deltaproteobacteria bacterium RIFCSPLOWO2_12_FULL_40_28]
MTVALYYGPFSKQKNLDLITQVINSEGTLLVDNAFQKNFFEQKIIEKTQSPLWGERVLTLDDFLYRLLKASLPRVHFATSSLKRHIIRKIIYTENLFPSHREFPSLVRGLEKILTGLKRNLISTENLAHTPLLKLYENYQKELKNIFHYDEGDLILANCQLLKEKKIAPLFFPQNLFLTGIYPLSHGERQWLHGIKECFPQINLTLFYAHDFKNDEEENLSEAFTDLGLLSDTTTPLEAGSKSSTALQKVADPGYECAFISHQIQELISQGVHCNFIAILLPTNTFYHKRLSLLLREAKIPHWPPYLPSLSQNPLVLDWVFKKTEEQDEALWWAVKKNQDYKDFAETWEFETDLIYPKDFSKNLLDQFYEEEKSVFKQMGSYLKQGIRLLNLNQNLDLEWEYLFVPGFTDGNYPKKPEDPPFLSKETKEKPIFRKISPGSSYFLTKNLLNQLVSQVEKKIWFIKPQRDEKGREVTLAPYHLEWENVSDAPLPIQKTHEKKFTYSKKQKKSFSISEIQTYLKCPHQYYAKYQMKLKKDTEDEVDVPADLKGSFIHRVFQKSLVQNQALYREAVLYDVYAQRFINAVETLIEQEATNDSFLSRANPQVKKRFCDITKTALKNTFQAEITDLRKKIKITYPSLHEWAFGTHAIPYLKVNTPDGEIYLTGRIDRIDVDDNKTYFSILDYKTGKLDTLNQIKNGDSIQLPLYVLAVQKLLFKNLKPASLYLVGLKNIKKAGLAFEEGPESGFLGSRNRISEKDWDTVIQNTLKNVGHAVKQINQGVFDPNPSSPDLCLHCDFRTICTKEMQ